AEQALRLALRGVSVGGCVREVLAEYGDPRCREPAPTWGLLRLGRGVGSPVLYVVPIARGREVDHIEAALPLPGGSPRRRPSPLADTATSSIAHLRACPPASAERPW
ncbi:MAG: hypothetical protein RLN75_00655, partial [Longimicrobiales bacterium]